MHKGYVTLYRAIERGGLVYSWQASMSAAKADIKASGKSKHDFVVERRRFGTRPEDMAELINENVIMEVGEDQCSAATKWRFPK